MQRHLFFLMVALVALFVLNPSLIFAQEQSSAWALFDPRDPNLPALVMPDASAFRIDPQWQVASIEYLYHQSSLWDPYFDYQTLTQEEGAFRGEKTSVSPIKVQMFLDSLRHLHPTHFLLNGTEGSDDYPSWTVELNSADGQSILLSSTSTANPGAAPWNVLVNGRMYAQYDGSLVAPLGNLFSSQRRQPDASMSQGQLHKGTVAFSTFGLPNQLVNGFSGLLPIADELQVQAKLDSQTVEGDIIGDSSIGGFGQMIIGTITDLIAVTLTVDDHPVECGVKSETADPAHPDWTFSCPVVSAKSGVFYHYPLQVQFATDAGETISAYGVLNGKWGETPDLLLMTPDEQLQAAMTNNPDARDLLSDHTFALAHYQAQIDTNDPQTGYETGEAILIGQTELDGQPIRYSIGTPYTLQDGALTRWDLSRLKLDALLKDVLASPLTASAAHADPRLLVNLWYAEANDDYVPDNPALYAFMANYGAGLAACGTGEVTYFPSETAPLRAFSFDSHMDYQDMASLDSPQFVLVDGKPQLHFMVLYPLEDTSKPIIKALLPGVLNMDERTPFNRVWLSNYFDGDVGYALNLTFDDSARDAAATASRAIAKAIGGKLDTSAHDFWEIDNLTFAVTDEGKITVAACPA